MQETRVIDDLTFIVDPLGAMTALKLKAEILSVMGSSLATLISGDKGLDSNIDLVTTVEKLMLKLDDSVIDSLNKKLMVRANVVFEGSPQMQPLSNEKNFDRAFSQNLTKYYKLVWFVLQVNYKDFLEKMGDFGNLIPTPTIKEVSKSTKSTKRTSVK